MGGSGVNRDSIVEQYVVTMRTILSLPLLAAIITTASSAITDPNFADGRTVIVHLFEWKWTDIAEECERFLGPYKFAGVQVSPPSEHEYFPDNEYSLYPYPWWQRYQPLGYALNSRSGTEAEFEDMVTRCNAVDVRIYVDAVINHMAAGSYDFPRVPYTEMDFNVPRGLCPSPDGGIWDVNNTDQMRYCNLLALSDIYYGPGNDYYGRDKVLEYMNKMVDMGVAGFRIDAAKHMVPSDLVDLFDRLHDCPFGGRPYIYQEVIDRFSNEAITPSEYFDTGDVTEFKFCDQVALIGRGSQPVDGFSDLGHAARWDMMSTENALVFVENHDNQRNHGGGGEILTYKEPAEYKKAVAFTLAWDFGTTRIFSGYAFNHSDEGPPSDAGGHTQSPTYDDQGLCGGGWVCEHRWPQIRNMACFRNQAGGEPVTKWWSNGNNFIAFSRGGSTFFALNNEPSTQSHRLQTGLPAGTYCDLITGDPTDTGCSGSSVTVDDDGMADIVLESGEDSMLALSLGATSGRGQVDGCVVLSSASRVQY
ncbi:alpha-amylase B-like [Diadema antillarum]|uniref:alpha-amylase B-like n=1 Tax=Diadema antillarum TaxID=105358 RepID=UPI003A86AFEC